MLTLFPLVLCTLAFTLSQTMVIPAIPEVQREYDTTTAVATFVLTGFLLTACVATPVLGRFGDMFGKARVLVIVLAVFAAGSLVAAVSSSIEGLIAGRLIQGVAGAVFPISFGIIRDELPAERVAGAIGAIGSTFGVGSGLGFTLGGVITDQLGFNAIFWLAFLLGAMAVVAVHRLVPESRVRSPEPIDWPGAALLCTGLAVLLGTISQGNVWGWGAPRTIGLVAAAGLVLCLWVLHEWRRPHPLVDMRMLRHRPVLATNLSAFLIGFGLFGSMILIPGFAQSGAAGGYGFGATTTEAGLYLLPFALAMLLSGAVAGWADARFGPKASLVTGAAVASLSFVLLAAYHGAPWAVYAAAALLGLGNGLSFAAMPSLLVRSVGQAETGVANGINTIMRLVGGAVGAQISAGILSTQVVHASGLPTEAAFTLAFTISAVGIALAVVAGLAVPSRARLVERPVF